MRILIIILLLLLFGACHTGERIIEVPVEVIKKEYISRNFIDTLIKKDSVYIDRGGDTVYKYVEKYRWHQSFRVDTVHKTDTVPCVVTIKDIEKVEVNTIYWYQKALMWAGGLGTLIILIYLIIKLKYK